MYVLRVSLRSSSCIVATGFSRSPAASDSSMSSSSCAFCALSCSCCFSSESFLTCFSCSRAARSASCTAVRCSWYSAAVCRRTGESSPSARDIQHGLLLVLALAQVERLERLDELRRELLHLLGPRLLGQVELAQLLVGIALPCGVLGVRWGSCMCAPVAPKPANAEPSSGPLVAPAHGVCGVSL